MNQSTARTAAHAARMTHPRANRVIEPVTGREGTHVETRGVFADGSIQMVIAFDNGDTEIVPHHALTDAGRANGNHA